MPRLKPARELTALEAARAFEEGSLTSEALVRSCLERIEERNAEVRAFTAWDPASALAQAQRAGNRGVLSGIPFGVKDVIDTAALATEYGSPVYEGHRPVADAGCVAMACEQGAIVLGKVSTSEFATQTPGPARNPLDLSRTPGGSSSGSAAAVADFMVPVAFGTQTTGSIVRPAAYCGIVGYKPTHGFFSSSGLKPLSPVQDTVGLLARDVADAAYFAFGVHGVRTVLQSPSRLRICVCESDQWSHASAEMIAGIETAVAKLEREGASVARLRLDRTLQELAELQPRIVAYEARQALAFERLHSWQQLSERLRARLDSGANVGVAEYLSLRQKVLSAQQRVTSLFLDFDALLYPAAEGEAEHGLATSGSPRFGALWTLLQLPCVSMPMARAASGMPLGAQLIGAYGEDHALLAASHSVGRLLAA